MILESTLQRKIIKYLKDNNIFYFKTLHLNKNGIPDIFMLYKGKAIFLELKTENGKISSIQQYQIDKIRENGATVYIIRNWENFLDIFKL